MNEQEMQFADPDWKPTGPLPVPQEDTVASAPLAGPVNSQPRNTSQSSDDLFAPYEQGYQGSWPAPPAYASSTAQHRPYSSAGVPRRRSHWWIWAIIAIIVISVFSSMAHTVNHGGYDYGPSFSNHMQAPAPASQFYGLNGATQLNINNLSGSITVQVADDSTNSVSIQEDNGSQPEVDYQGQSMIINPYGGDITVIIPQSVTLNLRTGVSDIEVDGFQGQLSAHTDSGSIRLGRDSLSGQSTIASNSGNIDMKGGSLNNTSVTSQTGDITSYLQDLSGQVTFSTGGNGSINYSGMLDPQGTYQFTTDSGSIDLFLARNASAQIQLTQKSGDYNNDFSSNNIGSSPRASVTITTNDGDVGIHKQ